MDTTAPPFANDDPARQLTALRQDLESYTRANPGGGMARLLAGRILALEEEVGGAALPPRRPAPRTRRG